MPRSAKRTLSCYRVLVVEPTRPLFSRTIVPFRRDNVVSCECKLYSRHAQSPSFADDDGRTWPWPSPPSRTFRTRGPTSHRSTSCRQRSVVRPTEGASTPPIWHPAAPSRLAQLLDFKRPSVLDAAGGPLPLDYQQSFSELRPGRASEGFGSLLRLASTAASVRSYNTVSITSAISSS